MQENKQVVLRVSADFAQHIVKELGFDFIQTRINRVGFSKIRYTEAYLLKPVEKAIYQSALLKNYEKYYDLFDITDIDTVASLCVLDESVWSTFLTSQLSTEKSLNQEELDPS